MNEHDPNGEHVPELIEKLEGSLHTPTAQDIRAGSQQRQSFRRRVLAGAGVFTAAVAITGAITLFNQDEPQEVTTASSDVAEGESELTEAAGAIADDSAPSEVFEPDPVPRTVPPPIPATLNIADCANSSTISAAGAQWLAWDLPPEWEGAGSLPVTVVITDNTLIATDDDGLTAPFTRNDGQPRPAPCLGFNYQQPGDDVPSTTTSTALPATSPTETAPSTTTTTTTTELKRITDPVRRPGTVNITDCVNTSSIELDSGLWFGVDLPDEWAGQGTVDVRLFITGDEMAAVDDSGLSGTFHFFEPGSATPAICKLFGDGPTVAPTTTPPPTTTTEPDTGGVTPAGPFPAIVTVANCANGSIVQLDDDEVWLAALPSDLPAEWEGRGSFPVTVIITNNDMRGTDSVGLSASFGRYNNNAARPDICETFG